jgi:hypothetical protein
MVVADRVRRLNQIQLLLKRPEIHQDSGLVSDARHILLHNLARFGGRVWLKTSSAVEARPRQSPVTRTRRFRGARAQ